MTGDQPGIKRTVLQLVAVVVTMGALAWAAIPAYNWFCRVTGYAGTTNVSQAAPDEILERTVTIRFDANTAPGMPWQFRPVEREVTLRIGETGLAFYEAYNPTDRTVAGTASYNVAPDAAGYYFNKIQCFCFEQQVLAPGERVTMPVSFYVDPAMVTDRDAKRVQHITLSYTFYETELPEEQAALAAPSASVN